MKAKEWNSLKKGNLIHHKHFGLCEVVDFVFWCSGTVDKDPVIMPKTDAGRQKLYRRSEMGNALLLETSKRLIQRVETDEHATLRNDPSNH